MRVTPSFNVCPLRTNRTEEIPDCVWHQSKAWFKRVIEELQPRTIICNGFSENDSSPWGVIKREFGIMAPGQEPERGRAVVKWGTAPGITEDGTTIIGLPLLTSQSFRKSLFDHLSELTTKLDIA